MKYHLPVVLKWVLTAAFFVWAAILAIVILGEESPESTISFFEFFLVKFMAIGSACATYKAAKWCYVQGLFPKLINTYIETCKKEEDEI